jgi:hypothetical protein
MINERSFNIRAVQIGGATGFLTMQLVDCFEESWAEENQVASIGRLLSKERALVQLCYTARGFHQGSKRVCENLKGTRKLWVWKSVPQRLKPSSTGSG